MFVKCNCESKVKVVRIMIVEANTKENRRRFHSTVHEILN